MAARVDKERDMAAPKDLKYTKTHEWVKVDGDTVILGITDAAQTELGDITYLELPEAGDAVTSGEPFGVVESVKAASDVYSPVDGEVVERNDEAIDSPELINQSPYEKAWLLKVKLSDPAQLDALLSNADYDSYAEENLG
jgi:glycine cleavage system H protein